MRKFVCSASAGHTMRLLGMAMPLPGSPAHGLNRDPIRFPSPAAPPWPYVVSAPTRHRSAARHSSAHSAENMTPGKNIARLFRGIQDRVEKSLRTLLNLRSASRVHDHASLPANATSRARQVRRLRRRWWGMNHVPDVGGLKIIIVSPVKSTFVYQNLRLSKSHAAPVPKRKALKL